MSQEYIEITEKTVDDAITTACQRLSVTSNRLDYIVLQREKSGFLGIGAKPAIIKARVKDAADATQAILDDVINKAEKKMQKDLSKSEDKKVTEKAPEPVKKKEVKEAKRRKRPKKLRKRKLRRPKRKKLRKRIKKRRKTIRERIRKLLLPKKRFLRKQT